jgi:hypothetical protein
MNAIVSRKGQEGGALAITLLLLMGLTALGAVFMTTSRTETQIAGNVMRHTQSLYLAEAGLNEAMARLYRPTSTSFIGEDTSAPHPGWGKYLVLTSGNSALDPNYGAADSDGLDNDLDGLSDESGEAYPEVPSAQSSLENPLNYPWVRITYSLDASNNLIRYGDTDDNPTTRPVKNLTTGDPVILVTSRGEQGTSKRTLEVELVRTPAPYMDACVYTEDDVFKFNGQRCIVSGFDHDPATGDTIPGAPGVPAIVTTADPNAILADIDPNQEDQVVGPDGPASVAACPYDLDLEGWVNEYSPYADFRYVGDTDNPNTTGWGGLDDYNIVYVKGGDLHLSGSNQGGGLLLVEGSLLVSGAFTWYGMAIVLGDINFTGGGDGIHVYGGVMSHGQVTRNDIGGQADILYCSYTLQKLSELKGFQVLSWKED